MWISRSDYDHLLMRLTQCEGQLQRLGRTTAGRAVEIKAASELPQPVATMAEVEARFINLNVKVDRLGSTIGLEYRTSDSISWLKGWYDSFTSAPHSLQALQSAQASFGMHFAALLRFLKVREVPPSPPSQLAYEKVRSKKVN